MSKILMGLFLFLTPEYLLIEKVKETGNAVCINELSDYA